MFKKQLKKIHDSTGPLSKNWEVFHENSKLGKYDIFAPVEWILGGMEKYTESLHYDYAEKVPLLEKHAELKMSLSQAIEGRESVRDFSEEKISFEELDSLLHYSYGINRPNTDNEYPRPFRNVPSGGGLYPLDIFFYSHAVKDLKPGLWHYNPIENSVFNIRPGLQARDIQNLVTQQEIAQAPVIFFIAAQFERNLFKYRDRGYRFIYLDAGHLAQNMNLVATALDLGSVNVGGYFDRHTDKYLDIDGITQSTVYMVAVGKQAVEEQAEKG